MPKYLLEERELAKLRLIYTELESILDQVEEIVEPMTDEEQALAHEECRHGEGSNYSEADWAAWLKELRAEKK